MFQHKKIKSAKEGECLKTWLPIILAFTWRLLGGKKKGFPNLKSAVIVCISFSIKYLKMASVIYLCASSHISNIGLREGREAVNIRAIMSPPLHSLWLIGTYKGEIWKHLCSYKCLFKSDKYLPGWTFQLRRIFCWLAAQETIFSTRWDYFKSSGSGVKCTGIPPLGFNYSVQKLHWLIMYVFFFVPGVSAHRVNARRWTGDFLILDLISDKKSDQEVPKMYTKYYQTSHQKS